MSNDPVAEWEIIEGEGLSGFISLHRGDHVIIGPLDSIRVDRDSEIFVVPKWLAVRGVDRWGDLMSPRRVHNHAVNPGIDEDQLAFMTVEGQRVAKFGRHFDNSIYFNQPCPVRVEDVAGLKLDDTGREPATFGLVVPSLVQVNNLRLVQRINDGRGVVVNEHPSSWVQMLFQGVKAYLGDSHYPEGYGDKCNEEFRIHFQLRIEPHLVAEGSQNSHNYLPTIVQNALDQLALDWGGVDVACSDWLEYGVHEVEISHLANSFKNGSEGSESRLLGFSHPSQIQAVEDDWNHCAYLLRRFMEDEIRQRLDIKQVESHFNLHGVPCPVLP